MKPSAKVRRVLMALPALDSSGVAFAVQNLIPALVRRRVRVMLLAACGGMRDRAFEGLSVEVAIHRHFGRPVLGQRAMAQARAFAPEIIHAQDIAVAGRARRIARSLERPLVVTANRLDPQECARFARYPEAGVAAVSDAIRERLTNQGGLRRERIRVIPNGLELSHFPCRPLEEEPADGPPRAPVVGAYGTLLERKGQRVLLEAARRVIESGVDAEFLLLGQGPDKLALRERAAALGIAPRITFSHSTTADLSNMRNFDLFVEPSREEGFGLSVLQAMAMGIPVVASGVGGIYALVEDGVTGALVPRGDAEAMAAAIRDLLAHPARRLDLARRARERVEERFSNDVVAGALLDFYAERRALPAGAGE